MDEKKLQEIKKRDYLKKEKFSDCYNIKSIKRYGDYYEKTPMITIIIPTYKRGHLITRAVKSALNQKKFDDYQVLIVDNEDNKQEMNETEKALREINSGKIIYFRNEKNIGGLNNWNRCLRLARSKWVCMLHDDDIITDMHLYIMMNIIKSFSSIDYLGCKSKCLSKKRVYNIEREGKIEKVKDYYRIHKVNYLDFNFGFKETVLLGSVFNRKKAILLGGFETEKSYFEDYFFVVKFAKYYNMYTLDEKMYKHIEEPESFSVSRVEAFQDELVHEYYLYRYLSKKRIYLLWWFYLYYSKVRILGYYNYILRGNGKEKKNCFNLDVLKKQCNMANFEENEMLYYLVEHIIKYRDMIYNKYIREYKNIKIV